MRPPELPVGSVLRSSGPACTMMPLPMTPSTPLPTEMPSTIKVSVALPYSSAFRLSKSPAWRSADYPVLCSAPRQALTPTPTPPTLNQHLAVIYAKAESKVIAAAKRKKDATADAKLLTKFKGEYPPSLLNVMAGNATSDGIGFHQIAMQIAITSNALNKSEKAMLELCEGLIQNHVSDGARYNTPAKRRAELSRMYYYTRDNACYTYSKDAVRRLVPPGVPTTDLDGLTNADGVTQIEDEGGLLGGVFVTETGVYRKTEDGVLKLVAYAE